MLAFAIAVPAASAATGSLAVTTTGPGDSALRAVPPSNLEPPTISGTPRVGERVTAHPGRWRSIGENLRYEYRWVRCEADGANCRGVTDGGDGSRYRIQPADWGRTLKVTVWARDSEGGAWAQSTHTAVIENR